MKRFLAALIMFTLLIPAAVSESLIDSAYIDVPAVMTQDSVVEILADEECLIEALEPDEESVLLLNNIYDFVWEEENRPARYYDIPTQEKITEMIGGANIDLLHMTETMRLQLTGETEETVHAVMRLDVEYYVGQLVIVVLGIPQETGEYVWYPYSGRVHVLGEIRWDIPQEDWELLSMQPINFHVLTDRIGARGGRLWGEVIHKESTPPSFSKDSEDVIIMHRWYTEWGEVIEDPFSVWLVSLTRLMEDEVIRIAEYLTVDEEDEEQTPKPLLDYFPAERKEEALLLLPEDVAYETLVAYDVIAMRDKDYKDTYGDVNVDITFATVYDPEKAMVVLAGFPIEDATEEPWMEWYVLRANALRDEEKNIDSVEIGLKQLFLPDMEEKPLMLIIISEPLEEEIPDN